MAENWAVGKDGKAIFGGTTICLTGWTLSESGDDADTTGSCTTGKTSIEINTAHTGTIEGIWDLDESPVITPPNLNRGATGTLQLFISPTQFYSFPARIKTMDVTSTVADVIKWSAGFESTGTVVLPI